MCVCLNWCACTCACTSCTWDSIFLFSTTLIFHGVIFALPTAICFYYLGEHVCLRISITINKAVTPSAHAVSIPPSASRTPFPTWRSTFTTFQDVIVKKQTWSTPVFSQTSHAHTAHNLSPTLCSGSCLDGVCAPLLQTVITVSHPVCP